MDNNIIKQVKPGLYNFKWRVIFEDSLYQLQRFSKEYNTWFTVKFSESQELIVKMYNEIKS